MRIAYEHADSFITYPQAPNLSAKAQPIRKRLTYPRRRNLSTKAQPIRERLTYLRAALLSAAAVKLVARACG